MAEGRRMSALEIMQSAAMALSGGKGRDLLSSGSTDTFASLGGGQTGVTAPGAAASNGVAPVANPDADAAPTAPDLATVMRQVRMASQQELQRVPKKRPESGSDDSDLLRLPSEMPSRRSRRASAAVSRPNQSRFMSSAGRRRSDGHDSAAVPSSADLLFGSGFSAAAALDIDADDDDAQTSEKPSNISSSEPLKAPELPVVQAARIPFGASATPAQPHPSSLSTPASSRIYVANKAVLSPEDGAGSRIAAGGDSGEASSSTTLTAARGSEEEESSPPHHHQQEEDRPTRADEQQSPLPTEAETAVAEAEQDQEEEEEETAVAEAEQDQEEEEETAVAEAEQDQEEEEETAVAEAEQDQEEEEETAVAEAEAEVEASHGSVGGQSKQSWEWPEDSEGDGEAPSDRSANSDLSADNEQASQGDALQHAEHGDTRSSTSQGDKPKWEVELSDSDDEEEDDDGEDAAGLGLHAAMHRRRETEASDAEYADLTSHHEGRRRSILAGIGQQQDDQFGYDADNYSDGISSVGVLPAADTDLFTAEQRLDEVDQALSAAGEEAGPSLGLRARAKRASATVTHGGSRKEAVAAALRLDVQQDDEDVHVGESGADAELGLAPTFMDMERVSPRSSPGSDASTPIRAALQRDSTLLLSPAAAKHRSHGLSQLGSLPEEEQLDADTTRRVPARLSQAQGHFQPDVLRREAAATQMQSMWRGSKGREEAYRLRLIAQMEEEEEEQRRVDARRAAESETREQARQAAEDAWAQQKEEQRVSSQRMLGVQSVASDSDDENDSDGDSVQSTGHERGPVEDQPQRMSSPPPPPRSRSWMVKPPPARHAVTGDEAIRVDGSGRCPRAPAELRRLAASPSGTSHRERSPTPASPLRHTQHSHDHDSWRGGVRIIHEDATASVGPSRPVIASPSSRPRRPESAGVRRGRFVPSQPVHAWGVGSSTTGRAESHRRMHSTASTARSSIGRGEATMGGDVMLDNEQETANLHSSMRLRLPQPFPSPAATGSPKGISPTNHTHRVSVSAASPMDRKVISNRQAWGSSMRHRRPDLPPMDTLQSESPTTSMHSRAIGFSGSAGLRPASASARTRASRQFHPRGGNGSFGNALPPTSPVRADHPVRWGVDDTAASRQVRLAHGSNPSDAARSRWHDEAEAYLTLVDLARVQSAASQRVSMSLVLRPLSQALTAAVTAWASRSALSGAGVESAAPPSELLDEEAEPLESAIIAAAASAWRSHVRDAPTGYMQAHAPSKPGGLSASKSSVFDLQQHLLEGSRCLGVRTGSCSGSALEAMLVGVTDCAVKHLHTTASLRGYGTSAAAVPLCLLLRAESHCIAGWCTVLGAVAAVVAAIAACNDETGTHADLEPIDGHETGESMGTRLEESVKRFTDELSTMSRRRAGHESSDAAEEHEVTVHAVAGALDRARLLDAARGITTHCRRVISKRSPSLLASIPDEETSVQTLWGGHESASVLLGRDSAAAEAEVVDAARRAAASLRMSACCTTSALDTLAVMPGLLPRLIRAVGNAHAAVMHNLACWAQGRGHGVQAGELLQWEQSVRLLPLMPQRGTPTASARDHHHQRWHSSPVAKPTERHRRLLLVPRDGVVAGAPLSASHGRDSVSSSLAFHRVLQPDGQRAAWESGNQAPTRPRLPPRPVTARSLLSSKGHAPGPSSRSKAHRRWSSAGPT